MLTLKKSGKNKGDDDHPKGHGWFVTFADLMSLMMSFFVMLLAFSHQDIEKMQIVAGSMRQAFGVQKDPRYSGVIEADGVPTRGRVKYLEHVSPEDATSTPSADEHGGDHSVGAQLIADRKMALASASLRQALQDMPELAEISRNVLLEETPAGINLQIVDQDGRAMFADGSKVPLERTRLLVQRLAAPLRASALRLSIVGHAAVRAPERADYDGFDLSWDRANAVRQILVREGLPAGQLSMLAGKGDTEPLYPDNPSAAGNHHPDPREPAGAAGSQAVATEARDVRPAHPAGRARSAADDSGCRTFLTI